MATDLEIGIGPKHNHALRETNNMMRRVKGEGFKVEVVLPWKWSDSGPPRPGCRIRRKGPKGQVNPFPRPCAATMRIKIRLTFRLPMHLESASLLKKATCINIVCDGKEFGPNYTRSVSKLETARVKRRTYLETQSQCIQFGKCPCASSKRPTKLPTAWPVAEAQFHGGDIR
jgi:hypothetical protein